MLGAADEHFFKLENFLNSGGSLDSVKAEVDGRLSDHDKGKCL